MKSKKLTALQILNETVKFYSEDPSRRALENEGCQYNTSDGKHCAVGRCLLPKYQKQGRELEGNGEGFEDFVETQGVNRLNFDKLLKHKYRGRSLSFWEALQSIHDSNTYWKKDKGLTEEGTVRVAEIKEQIKRKALK